MRPGLIAITLLLSINAYTVLSAESPGRVAYWDFGTEDETPLIAHGGVQRDQAGPRPPEFPDLADNNTAVRLDGQGAYLSVADPGEDSEFDFANGDALTLEAWVRLDGLRDGNQMYVVSKGRSDAPKFARDNQNWALRVVGARGVAKLSFLFATTPGSGGAHWHRWTSQSGFTGATGWHHIAVAYQFGDSSSIRGWIDGIPTTGTWDMGGATNKPPVVDDDAVWIGSSRAGSPPNSFRGWLDAVAIHREALDDKAISARFRRVGGPRVVGPQPERMPQIEDVPQNRVLVTFSEGLPSHERWLNEGETWPKETSRWLGNAFLLPRIPVRYDAWGIRAGWKAPLLVRMVADVALPPGRYRFLVRGRALSRLWIDGNVVARTDAITRQPPNGEEPITPVAKPPAPGLRSRGYHQQEVIADVTIPGTPDSDSHRSRIVFEMVVGGKNLRTETGEVCVALAAEDGGSFVVLQRDHAYPLPLTDAAIVPTLAAIDQSLSDFDDQTRRDAASSQDEFWAQRHERARDWTQQQVAPVVPPAVGSGAAHSVAHPVDSFISAKIEYALAAASRNDARQAAHFHAEVLPILRTHCFRCHGDKDKGGLRLDSRELALRGGDSEIPAVTPGDAAASELIARILSDDESLKMPPTGDGLDDRRVAVLRDWITAGAGWPAPPVSDTDVALAPLTGDGSFLRRVYLDTIGVPPSLEEVEAFLADSDTRKRERTITRLLNDERLAEHWISFWLDLLAENPTLLNASLNSTGPFRWFLYDSLRDNKPLDRMVTELILMRGSPHEGGSAGFAMAAENDAPFAAKGHIVASAFLGIELQCARCHDSPYHSTTQQDLFALAAMLNRKPATVPATSRVPDAFFEQQQRESLIRVTLKPDESVAAAWPFAEITGIEDTPELNPLMFQPDDSRERLATLITAPRNLRFSRVMVNRIWKQLIGAGLVEPVYDWEGRTASHPDLLDWLARELVAHDYDLRYVIGLVLNSQTYQRESKGSNLTASAELRFFNAPERRRLTAEQIVDSLLAVTGTTMDVEELTFVHDGRRAISNRLTLGRPQRAWMFASLNNERDRPSLSLPRARAVTDVLQAFGWTGSRQKPITDRDLEPNVLQPGVLANGTLVSTLTRATDGSELARLAIEARSPEALVDTLFLRLLNRRPQPDERTAFAAALAEGFDERLVPDEQVIRPEPPPPLPLVTWFNHLRPDANTIQQEVERRVRMGPPADPRLRADWREAFEDAVWSLINHREFVWMP